MRVMADQIRVRVHIGKRNGQEIVQEKTDKLTERMAESMNIYYKARPQEFDNITEKRAMKLKCTPIHQEENRN